MAVGAPITDQQNVLFLLSCLRNAQGPFQVNFHKVIEECDIVSVGAASKRLSRLSIKYQNGAPGENAKGEEGTDEADESPSKKTPNKANRGGKGVVKAEKDTMAAITAPRAAGVTKKRSPAKPKPKASAGSTATTPTAAKVEAISFKMEKMEDVGDDEEEFVPGFFEEQMSRGVGENHEFDTD